MSRVSSRLPLATALLAALPGMALATAGLPTAPAAAGYVPRIETFATTPPSDDGSIRHHIVVLRDVSPSRDDKIVVVLADVDQAPAWNGVLDKDGHHAHGVGVKLFIPDAYHVTTQVALHGPGAPTPTPVKISPVSDGATDRTISEKVVVTTSNGLGSKLQLASDLLKAGTLLDGKLPVDVNDSDTRTEEYAVSMVLKDYSVEGLLREEVGMHAASWSFNLARDIAADAFYFLDPAESKVWMKNNTRRMTPMMRKGAMSVSSVWRIPGGYEGPIDISTRATVVNRIYFPEESRTYLENDDADMSLVTRVNLGSPHLSRQPVVRLQSLADTGPCLVQPVRGGADITLAPCKGGEFDAAEQWTLELDNTFRNQGSKQCLTANLNTGALEAQACAGPALNQQWQWRADRLHTLYVEDGSWRLHVRDGRPNAMFNPALHQHIPSNVYHVLLRPWGSYPAAPTAGDVVPNLNSVSPPVPNGYYTFGKVSTAERWQPVPVRTGH
jgi:hypothetical protein